MDQAEKGRSVVADSHVRSEWASGELGAAVHPTIVLDQQETFQDPECKDCVFPLV